MEQPYNSEFVAAINLVETEIKPIIPQFQPKNDFIPAEDVENDNRDIKPNICIYCHCSSCNLPKFELCTGCCELCGYIPITECEDRTKFLNLNEDAMWHEHRVYL
jgi:hypothetical protein